MDTRQTDQKQKPIVLNLLKKEKRKSTMGQVKNLYIDMLENMSEEEREQHEINELMSDPDVYDQSVHKELSGGTSAPDCSHN